MLLLHLHLSYLLSLKQLVMVHVECWIIDRCTAETQVGELHDSRYCVVGLSTQCRPGWLSHHRRHHNFSCRNCQVCFHLVCCVFSILASNLVDQNFMLLLNVSTHLDRRYYTDCVLIRKCRATVWYLSVHLFCLFLRLSGYNLKQPAYI